MKYSGIYIINDNKIESFYTAKDGTIFSGDGEGSDENFNDPSNAGHIKQYKFNEKDITLTEICEKRKAHNFYVLGFNQLSNGNFVSFANDVKIWK